jgi:tetratricopeptide (TPR) repeat protein
MLCIACLGGVLPARAAEKETTRYFDQLRRRRLLRLAEGVCRRELARDDLTPVTRSQYTLELSRTLTEQAKYATGAGQAALWKQAAGVVVSYLKSSPKAPRRNWLSLQRCISLGLRGEFLRWDAELSPFDADLRKKAVAGMKEAIDEFRQLERTAPRSPSADDRRELRKHIQYQLAIAHVNLAEVLPAGSAERKDALRKAAAALAPLVAATPSSLISWNSHVLSARILRLEGDLRRATDRLARIQKQKPPLDVIRQVEVELVRLLLAKDLYRQADRILDTLQGGRPGLPGELAFLKVKTSIALWNEARKAKDSQRTASLFQQTADAVAAAEKTVGGYWSYRCRVLFGFLKDARQHGPEVAAALRKAQAAFEAKQWKAAAGEYATAAGLAAKSGNEKLAARLAFTAGSIEIQSGDFQSAAGVFQKLVRDHPESSRAAEADLMAAYCLGRVYDSLRTKARRLAYSQALTEHRRKFPKSPTIHEAAWMLATLHEYRGQTTEALKLYLSIPAGHPRASAARLAAARSYETIIGRLRDLKKPDDRLRWEEHAIAKLGEIIAGFPKLPATWDASQAEIALRTARIQLGRSPPRYDPAEPLLERVIASADAALRKAESGRRKVERPIRKVGAGMNAFNGGKPNPQSREGDASLPLSAFRRPPSAFRFWTAARGAARQLRIVSLAGTGRFDDARGLLADLEKSGPADVLAVLDGLMQIGSGADESVRAKLGELQLQTAQELNRNRGKLKPSERKWLDRCLAQAYESAGRPEQAVAVYEKLLAKSPRNRELLTKVATMLGESSDRASLRKARKRWQTLQSFDKPGTAGWLSTRYHVARCSFRLGDYAECRKLLTVTRLLYPELGGAELRGKYESLLKEARRKLPAERN